jgi:acetoin utilization protein AcuB
MLVKDWMTLNPVTIKVSATIQDAINLLLDNHINMVPVMDNGKLVGVLSDRDVKHASPSDACLLDFQNIMYHVARIQVADIMTSKPVTVTEDITIEETAEILLNNNISGVPVVNGDGTLKGIITKEDIFAALIGLSGLSHRGIQLGFELEDRAGSIKEVSDVIREFGGRLVSIVSTYEMCPTGYRHVYIRAFNIDRDRLSELIEKLKSVSKLLYFVDHKGNQREFYY